MLSLIWTAAPSLEDRRASNAVAIVLVAVVLAFACHSPALGAQGRKARQNKKYHAIDSKARAMEEAILRLTNKERIRAGLSPFVPSAALNYLARGQSRNMCRLRALQHESKSFPLGWRTFRERLQKIGVKSGGENIAYRTTFSNPEKWAQKIVKGWMKSPPHRKNILTAGFFYMGVGVAMCMNDLTYATQVFSHRTGRLP
jgi:uncharacterized protein YkwD